MHTHRIDSFLVSDNLRVELVHESNPYFAGEPISLVVRIRHLGSQSEYFGINEAIKGLRDEIERRNEEREEESSSPQEQSGNAWSMKSLLRAFNSEDGGDGAIKKENEKNAKLIESLEKQIKFHKPIELISGYIQISGVYQFDPEFIRELKLDETDLKMGDLGSFTDVVGGLESTESDQNDLTKFTNSKHTFSTFGLPSTSDERSGLLGESGPIFALGSASYETEYKRCPLLLIPQTLLFTELTLEPGATKCFRFKTTTLPKDLPPSYEISKNMAVNYATEFGVSKVLISDVKQYRIRVPIRILPYVSPTGGQYTSTLNRRLIILESGNVKELKNKSISQKRTSSCSVGTPRRISSFMVGQEKNLASENVIKNFVDLIKSNQNGNKEIEELVYLQMQMQFEDLNQEDGSNNSNPQDSNASFMSRKPDSVASNISNLRGAHAISSQEDTDHNNPNNGLTPQLSGLQNSYQINWNGQPITKLVLSSSFYTTSDDIDLVLEMDPASPPLHKVSAVTVSLEAFELVNRSYASDPSNISKPRGFQVYEARSISFDKCSSIPMKIILPKTPMNQLPSQFRTDVFQFKWMLVLKFVLVPRIENINLEQFYEDKKGILFHAKETLEGEEFSCHIPIPILPSSRSFGGW